MHIYCHLNSSVYMLTTAHLQLASMQVLALREHLPYLTNFGYANPFSYENRTGL